MMNETAEEDQAEVVAFLMRPESYSGGVEKVERIDTHGAMIFLVGPRAFKLKRAVKLAYLDFSTPAKRHAVCERELELNGATAPQLYRGVIPITRDAATGDLSLGGDGDAVDWVIEMERFADDQLFDRLAVAGKLDDRLMERLAEVVERLHMSAPVSRNSSWPASLETVVGTVVRAFATATRTLGADKAAVEAYSELLQATFARHGVLFAQRREPGLVRRCHGDLHLKNIVLFDGEPCLFDALEFDEDLGRIDVLYDLAFLIMDLWYKGLRSQAHRIFSHYFTRDLTEMEWRGLAAFPFFMSLRSGVRAMVGLDGLKHAEGQGREGLAREITAYMGLADVLLRAAPPRLIAIGGLSGTGKSTVARAVAPDVGPVPGPIILRSDVERKLMRGAALTEQLSAEAYAPDARDEVYARLFAKAEVILRSGHSVILDAVFDEPQHRDAASTLAKRAAVPFEGIWLDAPAATLISRVDARSNDASDADASVVRRQIERTVAPADWRKVDAGGSIEETAEAVRQVLKQGTPDGAAV